MYISLPPICGALSGKMERLCRSLYGLNQALRTCHHHLVRGIKPLGFEQCEADVCVMRSVGEWCSRHRLFIGVLNVKAWGGVEYDMI